MTITELLASVGITLTEEQESKLSAEFPKAFKPAQVYNNDVKKHKDAAETYKSQLDQANKQIAAFEDMDIDSVKKSAEEWKQKAQKAQQEAQEKLAQMQFDHALDGALSSAKARDIKAVKALLDMDALKLAGDKIVGLDEQLTQLKSDKDFLFEAEKEAPAIFSGKAGGAQMNMDAFTRSVRSGAGLADATANKN